MGRPKHGQNMHSFKHAVVILGSCVCRGLNSYAQIGTGAATTTDVLVPTTVTGVNYFTQLAAGQRFTCGLRMDGVALCCELPIEGVVYVMDSAPHAQSTPLLARQ